MQSLIRQLRGQENEYLAIHSETGHIINPADRAFRTNNYEFNDAGWKRILRNFYGDSAIITNGYCPFMGQ